MFHLIFKVKHFLLHLCNLYSLNCSSWTLSTKLQICNEKLQKRLTYGRQYGRMETIRDTANRKNERGIKP